MKAKALFTAVLLAASNFAWANGGLSIDNTEQHMNADNWADTQTDRPEIVVQGPADKFDVELPNQGTYFVDTDQFKQSYDGHA